MSAHVTVEEARERLLLTAKPSAGDRRPSRRTRSLLYTHLIPFFEDKPLGRITRRDVERLMFDHRQRGLGPKITRHALVLLHGIFDYSCREGWCSQNPCRVVDKPRAEQSTDIRFLDQSELAALLNAVPTDTTYGPTDRVLVLTAAMTGLRQNELLALRWMDVDWTASQIRASLERHFQDSRFQADRDLVFPDPRAGGALDHSYLVQRFKEALKAAGVRRVRFHDLRNTFGTRMAAAGVPMRTLQEWLGHRGHATTLIYADYAPASHEAALVERAFASERPENRDHIGTTGPLTSTEATGKSA